MLRLLCPDDAALLDKYLLDPSLLYEEGYRYLFVWQGSGFIAQIDKIGRFHFYADDAKGDGLVLWAKWDISQLHADVRHNKAMLLKSSELFAFITSSLSDDEIMAFDVTEAIRSLEKEMNEELQLPTNPL